MAWFRKSKPQPPLPGGDDPSVFGEVGSVAGVGLGMSEREVLDRLGEPVRRRSAREIWGQGAAIFYRNPDVVEAWLYDLTKQDKSLMVVVEQGRVRTLSLQHLT